MSETNHVGLWNHCLYIIKDNIPEQAFKTWFNPIRPLKFEDDTLTLQVPSQFFYEYLEEHYVNLLRQVIYKVFGKGTRLMYNVMVVKDPETTTMLPPHPHAPNTQTLQTKKIPQVPIPMDLDSHLKDDYNFENFIEGESNKLSRTVAEAVALNPAKTIFNPLFIYGSSGVGKTHLVNAIGTKIKELYPEKLVLYVSAHLFQVQYTDSIRNNTFNDFITFYQKIDVLIIDDIQEFAGATKTQNTFFHIFNHLHQNGKQLILTADRSPVLLQGVEERLITRFKWGMVAELEKPTVELRKNILLSKIRRDGLQFPPEVIDYIAENVSESVRDLEGVIISIMTNATIYNRDIDLDLAQRIVRKIIQSETKPITIDDIVVNVCNHFGLDTSIIYSKSRKREVAQARQITMYLAKSYTDLSVSKIGKLIGNKHHSTVLYACKAIEELKEVDKNFRAEIEEIQANLRKV